MSVAIVMPEIGFDEVPMRPMMRDDTVTKKKPKTMIRTAARKFHCVGILGATARKSASSSESDEHDGHRHVALGAERRRPRARRPPKSFTLSRNDETMVGIVRASVMRPAASTAPAPV